MRERVRVRMAGAEPEKVAEPFGRHLSPGKGIVAVRCKVPCPPWGECVNSVAGRLARRRRAMYPIAR